MSKTLKVTQVIDAQIDWEKFARDLKKEFDISASEEDIEEFCINNEEEYLILDLNEENDIEKIHINDLTGDEKIIYP